MTVIEADIQSNSDVLLAIEEIQTLVLDQMGEDAPIHEFLGEVIEVLEQKFGGQDR